jgi:hypothetical protein
LHDEHNAKQKCRRRESPKARHAREELEEAMADENEAAWQRQEFERQRKM